MAIWATTGVKAYSQQSSHMRNSEVKQLLDINSKDETDRWMQ